MSKKMKSLLPKVEIIILFVFFISFLIWTTSKCSETKVKLKEQALMENQEETLTDSSMENIVSTKKVLPSPSIPPTSELWRFSKLYVVIDGLNLRKEPKLKSDVIVKLPLFEEVFFMNEVTDSTEQINLGYEIADEPWVKIRTRKGHEGWVYGAGVNFYKKERKGVLK